MRAPTYFVLASLQDGPLHGSGIIERAAELSGGRVRLATGTLYPALDRLTGEGYVSLVSEKTVAGRVRRAYGLTRAGLTACHAEADRMEQASRAVSAAGRRAAVGGIVVVGGRVRVVRKARTA
jgi:PadR family transcriptional regulator, regulatory protein PadR